MKSKTREKLFYLFLGIAIVLFLLILVLGVYIFKGYLASSSDKQDISLLLAKTKGDIAIGRLELGKEVNYSESEPIWDNLTLRRAEVKQLEIDYFNASSKAFVLTLDEVVNKSLSVNLSTAEDFDVLYNKYMPIFILRYDKTLDEEYANKDYIQTAQELITNEYIGDCEDFATLLLVMAIKKNQTARIAVSQTHAWLQIYKNGRWLEYDSTSNKICADCISKQYSQVAYYSRP